MESYTVYHCPKCEEEDFSGEHTLRGTSSQNFAERHAELTGHTISMIRWTDI